MFPHRRLPYHITVLYVFACVNLMALFHVALVEAEIIVISPENRTRSIISDIPADFAPLPPVDGIIGYVLKANPYNACSTLDSPPRSNETNIKWFALIQRYVNACSFDSKVKNAQEAKFDAAIIHNYESEDLIRMTRSHDYKIEIPAVFIGYSDGVRIREKYAYPNKFLVQINPDYLPYLDIDKYIVPFATVIGMCFIITLVILLTKFIRDRRRQCRNRLSTQNLKKIPIKKFKKGDANDVCAICLDEYNEGDKLRVLPCSHAYHSKCIDPWLTNNKRTCPVCKSKVILEGDSSDSDSDEENENQPTETTPLLSDQSRMPQSTAPTINETTTLECVQQPNELQETASTTTVTDTVISTDDSEICPTTGSSPNSAKSSELLQPVAAVDDDQTPNSNEASKEVIASDSHPEINSNHQCK